MLEQTVIATVELKRPHTSYKFSGRELGVNHVRRGMKGPENECDECYVRGEYIKKYLLLVRC